MKVNEVYIARESGVLSQKEARAQSAAQKLRGKTILSMVFRLSRNSLRKNCAITQIVRVTASQIAKLHEPALTSNRIKPRIPTSAELLLLFGLATFSATLSREQSLRDSRNSIEL